MQQQFISQPVTYQTASAGLQSFVPQVQAQSVAVPQMQNTFVPVQSSVPQVQSVVPQVSMVPQVQQIPVTPYIQPIGSRHPFEQNHVGLNLAPGTFSTLGGSPYGRVSQLTTPVGLPGTSIAGASALTSAAVGGLDPTSYLQHVEILRKACEGAGTDEDAICQVIASTNNQERALIRRLYNQKYNEDLVARIQSELSGDFKEAAMGSFMTPSEYDAYCLNGAMKGLGTREGVLTEIIGSRTPEELARIKQIYASNYGAPLETVVADETSGDYQKLLLSLLQNQRGTSPQPDMLACQQDAAALYQAGEGKMGTDENVYNRIFTTRSPAELALINQYYKQHTGKGLLGAIDSEFSGDTKDLLNTIVRSNVYPHGYYAKNIYDSVKGLGTNDSKLIRNVCARHAVDLPYIKQAYQNDYGSDMLADIQGDTSGHYRQVLTSLVANAK